MNERVEQITGIIGDPQSWTVVTVEGGTAEDPLVNVPAGGRPGAMVRMRRSEAISRGLWSAEDGNTKGAKEAEGAKGKAPARNKARRAGANKAGGRDSSARRASE